MGKKYICEVKRDWANNEIELVNQPLYNTEKCSAGEDGKIKFKDGGEMHKYFKHHCVSEDELRNESSVYSFLFFILLLMIIVYIVIMLFKNGKGSPKTSFGRFSF